MITQIGKHRVQHGDVTKGIDRLMAGDKADIIYSDPPWGGGNIKYWATMNRKMTGQWVEPSPLEEFLEAIFGIIQKYAAGYVAIEYGVRWRGDIQERAAAIGLQPLEVIGVVYDSKNLPLDLHLFSVDGSPLPPGYADSVAGTKGYECVRRAFGPLADVALARNPEAIALDPCCGMGYTAQASKDFGLAFRGNELNAARLQKTIDRLRK